MSEPLTSKDLCRALALQYSHQQRYGVAFEVHDSTGGPGLRRLDALVMHYWPSDGRKLLGIEMKVSRADFKREIDSAGKAEAFSRHCHEFAILAPRGLLKAGELPTGWGLLEAFRQSKGIALHWAIKPVRRTDILPMPLGMQASVVRGMAAAQRLELLKEYGSAQEAADAELFAKYQVLAERFTQLQTSEDELRSQVRRLTSDIVALRRGIYEAWTPRGEQAPRWSFDPSQEQIDETLRAIRVLRHTEASSVETQLERIAADLQHRANEVRRCLDAIAAPREVPA